MAFPVCNLPYEDGPLRRFEPDPTALERACDYLVYYLDGDGSGLRLLHRGREIVLYCDFPDEGGGIPSNMLQNQINRDYLTARNRLYLYINKFMNRVAGPFTVQLFMFRKDSWMIQLDIDSRTEIRTSLFMSEGFLRTSRQESNME